MLPHGVQTSGKLKDKDCKASRTHAALTTMSLVKSVRTWFGFRIVARRKTWKTVRRCTTTQTFSRFRVLTHTRSMAAARDKRTDDWASPGHFHRYAHRYSMKIRAEIQREQSRNWTVLSKEDPRSGNDKLAPSTRPTNTKDDEARSVLPRGSVIQQNMTKLASIATRSTAHSRPVELENEGDLIAFV